MASTRTTTERTQHVETEPDPGTQTTTEPNAEDDEFTITVKKIDTVVRPRGVLAE